jgi:FkbM family methyltransferase
MTASSASHRRAIFPPEQEEALIRDFFRGKPPGYFVDVGAADPEFGSQTFHLEQAGWRGVLVEPRPDLARKLEGTRRAKVVAAACSSRANAGRKMPLRLRGGYSTLNDRLVISGLEAQGAIEVPVRTLDDILMEAQAPSPVDFVSIDVEGHEAEVIDGFDLARWRPRLLLVEDHVLTLDLHRLLQRRGYRWVRRTGLNGWYVPAETAMRIGPVGSLQFLRKYYLDIPTRRVRDAVRRVRARAGVLPPSRGR